MSSPNVFKHLNTLLYKHLFKKKKNYMRVNFFLYLFLYSTNGFLNTF